MLLKLYRRGKIWHYAGTISGRRIRGSTEVSDKIRAQRIASQVEDRAWKRRLDGPSAAITFVEVSLLYRQAGKAERFLQKVEDYWKATPLKDITAGAIRRAAIVVYPTASAATRNRQFIVPCGAIINFGAENEWNAPIRVKRFKVETKVKTPVTLEWVEAFVKAASPHMGALCLFMFGTGARVGEATALTWDDIDLSKATARVRQTKIGVERLAHLPPRLVAALANIPSNREPTELVFKYVSRESTRKVWDTAIERAKIERLSPHCCRHGFATTMLRAGVDVKTVAYWGGWTDPTVLLRTYAHALTVEGVTDVIFDTPVPRAKSKKAVNS